MVDEKKKSVPEREEEILKFWEEHKIFEQSLAKNKKGKSFVFYEGPPTANGLPGIHHIEARAFKDIIPRYKTMRGFRVPRKAGWDTHGLPVEIQVEKELGLKNKQDIERYGIGAFNQRAKESVWQYKEEWEKLTKRMGFWIDLTDPYITYDTSYVESLWWIIKEFWKKDLLEQDFKILPWCVRCQTGLSSHELAQGYKLVKDKSVYVAFEIKSSDTKWSKTSIISWTTTPWTLPGNVALAINPKLVYLKIKDLNKDWYYIVAKDRINDLAKKLSVESDGKEINAEELIGLSYEPLFYVKNLQSATSYKVYAADFVTAEDGTGVVHTAVMYGEDDYKLGKKIGLPTFHTVDEMGRFIGTIDEVGGQPAKNEETEEKIISFLKNRKMLLLVDPYEHDYPFCWRCSTPLLYYARQGWWVRTTKVKKQLLANNEKINWVPEHLKHGRFGEFLKDVRDWAFSRERYWGTPLPIWRCAECKHTEVIGSRDDLKKLLPRARNTYIGVRHGESVSNIKNIVSSDEKTYPLTLKGRSQAMRAGTLLKKKKVDLIITSPVLRARQTAEIIAKALGNVPVRFDARLKEIHFGVLESKPAKIYNNFFQTSEGKLTRKVPGGESLLDMHSRVLAAVRELEEKHEGKNIVIVSHDYPLWFAYHGARGKTAKEAVDERESVNEVFKQGVPVSMEYVPLPRDEQNEINLHRPYIDECVLPCVKCEKGIMTRVPEVADVWFDSGAMPFAQGHYPFEKKTKLEFPADYISEAVDQTRGWFYTLLAVATLLGKKAPYKNVISLGHVLDKNGQKMSKSRGNVVNPDEMIQKYGVDALRWYFYTVNAPGEPKKFDERDLANKYRGFVQTLWNSFVLFDTYVKKAPAGGLKRNSLSALDQWILTRLDQLTTEVTANLERYDIVSAGRLIEEFVIDDFSQWYLRRSRRRFQQPESRQEFAEVSGVTAEVLLRLSLLVAPFIPFTGEMLYQKLKEKCGLKELSVHLNQWPVIKKKTLPADNEIIAQMKTVRAIVAEALKLRADAGIKVRQPLNGLQITNEGLRKKTGLLKLIRDEVNVKKISFGKEMRLDIVLTQKLREEGMVRELVRNIQEMRRDMGLKPKDVIKCQFAGDAAIESAVSRLQKQLQKDVNAKSIVIGGKSASGRTKVEREIEMDGEKIRVGITLL